MTQLIKRKRALLLAPFALLGLTACSGRSSAAEEASTTTAALERALLLVPFALLGLTACSGRSSAAEEATTTTAAPTTAAPMMPVPACNEGYTVAQDRWIYVNGTLISNPDRDETTDGDETLVLHEQGEDDFIGIDWSSMECVLLELNVPDRVMAHIGDTRVLDGQQTDSWDNLEARWTHHPDDGLEIMI